MAVHPTCRGVHPVILRQDPLKQAGVITMQIGKPHLEWLASPAERGTPELLLRVKEAANDSSARLHVVLWPSWRCAVLQSKES